MKTTKKCLALLLSALILAGCMVCAAAEAPRELTKSDALRTEGTTMVNQNGDQVFLRGVNLGGWLIQEDWFCPTDNGERGDHWTMQTLTERFGVEKTYELYNIYWDNWITEYDFAQIAEMGFNCVRIPFWYRNFQSDDQGTWIRNQDGEIDFSRLDWAVEMCRKYGIYAILDFHGANGCQGMQDHCGQQNNCRFFDQTAQGEAWRKQALEIWTLIARRFRGDPAIAMFDLLNEPLCDVPRFKRNYKLLNAFYNDAYQAVRAEDPTRVICMMGTWDIGKLPKPESMGWTNVVYQLHQYDATKSSYLSRIDTARALGYRVPLYAGEFHPTGKNAKVTVGDIISLYEAEGVMWTAWTYKGYNSWAAWADWFIFGSTEDKLTVDPQTDSYEQIAEKWGAMATDGGQFYSGHLDEEVLPFLPNGKQEEAAQTDVFRTFFEQLWRRIRIVIELIVTLFS